MKPVKFILKFLFLLLADFKRLEFVVRKMYDWRRRIHNPKKWDEFMHRLDQMSFQDREQFILSHCKKRHVCHVGFLDSPYTEEKAQKAQLLHQKISSVSLSNFGVDIDTKLSEIYKRITGDDQWMIWNLENSPSEHLDVLQRTEVVVLGEVVEHMSNPVLCLQNLVKHLGSDVKYVFSVPSATTLDVSLPAMWGVEPVHPDHVFWYSPVTFKGLLERAGLKVDQMNMYDWSGKGIGCSGSGIVVVASAA